MLKNNDAFFEAKKIIPGGVNSPVRSFNNVGGTPFFTKKAKDCFLYDIEDKRYIDFICSWGANIVGHANENINNILIDTLKNGYSFGTPTELETILVKKIINLMPNIEKLRLVNSGTEAVMSAIRLARGYTNRDIVIKFNGCYHGHTDSMLVNAGSGASTFNNPNSSGITKNLAQDTIVLEYNDINAVINTFEKIGDKIAGVIVEPIAGNMNMVLPIDGFLQIIQKKCNEYGALFICDEVMTCFRVNLSGAQSIYKIQPDITILGKIIGGGMPIAAFGGLGRIMDYLAPDGPVYQAGTLSGNPIAVTSGIANISIIEKIDYEKTFTPIINYFMQSVSNLFQLNGIKCHTVGVGAMFGIHFNDVLPNNLEQVLKSNNEFFNKFFHYMLKKGIYFAPSIFEAGFINLYHNKIIIDEVLNIMEDFLVDNVRNC
jgi:glutamate-1-semialdehyde 2,1-aminomutase